MIKRITFVISSLAGGGAERVMTIMANYWACKDYTITLITYSGADEEPFYKLDKRVRYIPLGLAGDSKTPFHAIFNNIRRARSLRESIVESRPDAVVSFMTQMNVTVILATRGLSVPVIVSEHIEPAKEKTGIAWRALRRMTFPLADRVVMLSERWRSYYSKSAQNKAVVIPNPVMSPNMEQDNGKQFQLKKPSIISMGRFDYQKGFDILLKTFAEISSDQPDWSLTILGDGVLRDELEELAKNLGIESKVFLPGKVSNPYPYLKEADLFVMSSRYEGFPMALCEAMSCGVPVISFDCKTGPREIVRDGVDGILVPPENIDELANAMRRLMRDKKLRESMSLSAKQVVERFGVKKVMRMWESILTELSQKR